MKIKELIKILERAPDKEREIFVFINGLPQDKSTDIGYTFNDNNDKEIIFGWFIISFLMVLFSICIITFMFVSEQMFTWTGWLVWWINLFGWSIINKLERQ